MTIEETCDALARLLREKQAAYGTSFWDCGRVLEILYPDGVHPSQYVDMLCIARILDKLFRVAINNDPSGESPYRDIAGYGVLGCTHGQNPNNPAVPKVSP